MPHEAYTGTFYINKKGSELELGNNRETKTYVIPKEEWVAVPRPDLAIIDKELFVLARRIREARQSVYATSEENSKKEHFKGYHLFSSKVFCGECGSQFVFIYTDRNKSVGAYRDHFLWKSHAIAHCENKKFHRVYEETLIQITKEAVNRLVDNRDDVFEHVVKVIRKAYAETGKKKDSGRKKGKEESKLKKYEAEKVSYFESWRTAPNDEMRAYFYEKIQEIPLKIAKEEGQKQEEKKEEEADVIPIEELIGRVEKTLDSFRHVDNVTKDIVDAFVQKIIIYKDGRVDIILKTEYRFGKDISEETAYCRKRKGQIAMDDGNTSGKSGRKDDSTGEASKEDKKALHAFSYDMNVKPQTRGIYHGYKGTVMTTNVCVQI